MPTALQENLSDYIKKVELASRERQQSQEALSLGNSLSLSDKGQLEAKLRRANEEIATLAEQVNRAFREAAAEKARIDPIKVPTKAVTDANIYAWLTSLKVAIEKHNTSLGGDNPKLAENKRVLERQLQDAERMERTELQVLKELEREADKIKKRVGEIDKQLAEREKQVATLKGRVERVRKDQTQVAMNLKKLEQTKDGKQRQMEALERQKVQAEGTRSREQNLETKRRERAKIEQVDAELVQQKRYVQEEVDFRLEQYKKVDGQLRTELATFQESQANGTEDIAQLTEERTKLEALYRECGTRMGREHDRVAEIRRHQGELQHAIAEQPY